MRNARDESDKVVWSRAWQTRVWHEEFLSENSTFPWAAVQQKWGWWNELDGSVNCYWSLSYFGCPRLLFCNWRGYVCMTSPDKTNYQTPLWDIKLIIPLSRDDLIFKRKRSTLGQPLKSLFNLSCSISDKHFRWILKKGMFWFQPNPNSCNGSENTLRSFPCFVKNTSPAEITTVSVRSVNFVSANSNIIWKKTVLLYAQEALICIDW